MDTVGNGKSSKMKKSRFDSYTRNGTLRNTAFRRSVHVGRMWSDNFDLD